MEKIYIVWIKRSSQWDLDKAFKSEDSAKKYIECNEDRLGRDSFYLTTVEVHE